MILSSPGATGDIDPAAAGLRVHLANGLYLNALLDRLIGGFRAVKSN